LKQSKKNCVHTISNTATTKENTKQIAMYAFFRSTDSIENNTQRNTKSFAKIEANQSAYLWARQVHNFKKSKAFLAKCLEEQDIHRHNSRKQKKFNIIFIQELL